MGSTAGRTELLKTELSWFNRTHPDVYVLILKIRISQNTSIYCQYVSWQLISTIYSHHQAIENHISAGMLSFSAHIWDPKNIYRIE